ncbi:MAG: ABC transporter ATP-binding protein [Betaproteobacteria bacterium]|nr:ABC transporter ATP-binding protein [Betaproteobacteria bacterium]
MPSPHIQAVHLRKQYGKVLAVSDVSFSVERGQCFGLLGPNGAGKTTTIEMMEGVIAPDSGQVLFMNQPLTRSLQHKIGIQFQNTSLQDFLTVRECLGLFASLYAHHRSIDELICLCALEDFLDRDNRKLSGGQRQRLLLALALINDPELVFLDEPTTGLDPQARRNLWSLVGEIKSEGKSIILTTHYMEEAYVLCDQIAIMDKGSIIAQGEPKNLLREYFEGQYIEIPEEDLLGQPPSDFGFSYHKKNNNFEFHVPDVKTALSMFVQKDICLNRMTVRSASLEDLFLHLTGRELRE